MLQQLQLLKHILKHSDMRLFLLAIFITLFVFCKSQGGFHRTYYPAHSASSYCTDAFEAPNGQIILTGTTADTIKNANLLCIVGTDANGNFLWSKKYGRSTFEYLANGFISRSVITDANNFYLYSAALDSNNKYFSVFMKFDYNGDTLWQKKYYDPTDHLYIQGVTKSVDNGFLMTGFFEGSLETTLLIKTDNNGNELWRKKIQKGTGINTQVGHKIIQDSATGKIVIAGHQYEADQTQPANFSGYANVIVTNSIGIVLSKMIYSGACGSGFRDLIQTRDKKCIAVGSIDQCNNYGGGSLGVRRKKGFIVKFDLNNLNPEILLKEFDTLSTTNHITAITELDNSDLVVIGHLDLSETLNQGNQTLIRIIKLDKNGNVKWKKYLDRDKIYENTQEVTSINKMANGGFVMAGQVPFRYPAIKPYLLIKIDSIACDSSATHCATLNLVEIKEVVSGGIRFKIYPNPFKDQLSIETNYPEADLILRDVSGRVVKRIRITQNTSISLGELSSGMYLITLVRGKEIIHHEKIIKE